ncbi:ribosome-binding factor A, partial [Robiginitalea biformata]|uniref:ribosome-binding factor A n=1 Tax=Robiginitalea biformata TaxID=252307 RepID=UPI003D35655F
TSDLAIPKVYVRIFPVKDATGVIKRIQAQKAQFRHELARRTRNQLRRVPGLQFYLDDSLEYIENIEKSLKEGENAIE